MIARNFTLCLAPIAASLGLVAATILPPQDRRPPPKQDQKAAPATDADDDKRAIERIERMTSEAAESGELACVAIVVARGGEPLLARGWGYADASAAVATTEDTVFEIGALSRLFVNVAVLQLVQAKRLSLDDELSKLVPEFPAQGNKVTLHQLLSDTSGIAHPKERLDAEAEHEDKAPTIAERIAAFANEPFEFAPGERFSPNEANTTLLVLILEKTTGLGLAECLDKNLLLPLGLRQTHLCKALLEIAPEPVDAGAPVSKSEGEKKLDPEFQQEPGTEREHRARLFHALDLTAHAESDELCSTAMDLFLWQRALIEHAALDEASTRLLSAKIPLADGKEFADGYGLSSGESDGVPELTHGPRDAEARACVAYYPDADLTVVVVARGEQANASELERRIARAVLDLPEPGVVDLELSAEERALYVGAYQIGTTRVVVLEKDGRLVFQRPDPPDQKLLFQGKHKFLLEGEPETSLVFKVEGERAIEFVLCRKGFESIGKRFD